MIKSIIDTSSSRINLILSNTKKHMVAMVEDSGIAELLLAYNAALGELGKLCGGEPRKAVYLPPAGGHPLYGANWGSDSKVGPAEAPIYPFDASSTGSFPAAAVYARHRQSADMLEIEWPQIKYVFLNQLGQKIGADAQRLKNGLETAGRLW